MRPINLNRRRLIAGGTVLALAAGSSRRLAAEPLDNPLVRLFEQIPRLFQDPAVDPLAPVAVPTQVPATERVAELADTSLWYWDTGGGGQPVVLLHPASGSALSWGYQQPVFAAAGYRVIGFSRRGYYGSSPLDHDRPGVASDDLHQLVDHLNLESFHLVGSAQGGSVAADYAFSHPERCLSLTVSSNQFGVVDGDIAAAAARIKVPGFDDIPVEFREVGPSYRARNPDGWQQWIEVQRRSGTDDKFRQPLKNRVTEAMLPTLKVPVLVICGAADLLTPPAVARLIAARIPGAELVVAPEAGHSVYWEEPDLFNRAVLAFIGSHGPR